MFAPREDVFNIGLLGSGITACPVDDQAGFWVRVLEDQL